MQNSKLWLQKDLVGEFDDVEHFNNSLKELRDLRSQLHHAADYCESSFLNTKEKKVVLENTKEYVCRAVVTLVDHFGCVSENISGLISNSNECSEAELRIDSLKQRFLLSQQFVHNLALSTLQLREIIPRHQLRYLSAPNEEADEKSGEDLRDSRNAVSTKVIEKSKFEREKDSPIFAFTHCRKPSLSKGKTNSASLFPIRDGFSILSKVPNPSFHFQETKKNTRIIKRSLHGSDIWALIRRTKRTA
ncbi:probable protein ABIL5 isoform X1 [Humulus lupulus]|uniref:probable protein ABIL5 isoform X1 n=1 Tax=Humulus lupulus TaxID=3486 RepID=UPI002B402201|nr:probable protein ABIL5 isoform X1 [Humulus lupulus]